MSHTLAIHDKRVSSGEMKAVDDTPPKMTDWWADFGVGDRGLIRPSAAPEKRVETSGLFFLKELAEDLKSGPKPLAHVETPAAQSALMIPPSVLPSEAALDARPRSVWIIPGVLGALLFVGLLSALGTLWVTGRAGNKETAALAMAPAANPTQTTAPRSVAAVATAPSSPKDQSLSTAAPMSPPPARPVVGIVPPAPVDKTALSPITDEDRAEKRKQRRKRRRERRRARDREDEEDKPAPVAANYSLYATLGSVGSKPAPKAAMPAAKRPGGVATETVAQPRPLARTTTFRMLKVAAAGESRKPVASKALPARLPASAVTRALGRIRGAVQTCLRRFGFAHATIRLRVTVSGATGRVTATRVLGRFGGAPAGRCAERRARTLRFGRFTQSSQTILLPIRTR